MATPPEYTAPPQPPELQSSSSSMFYMGNWGVIGVKIAAISFAISILTSYIMISYFDSPFWLIGIIFGVIGLVIGIVGVLMGNIKISRKPYVPTLNIILIIISIIFFFAMPIFGSWEDPRTIGEALWKIENMAMALVFAVNFLCYIELAHASCRFSSIDEYATSHNLKEFNVNTVVSNYFIWFVILMVIISVISFSVLILQIGLSGTIKDVAPQFGYSLEYNSIYSLLISIAIVFVPIGIVVTFIYSFFFKSHRSIVVKSKEDIVARRPEMVEVK